MDQLRALSAVVERQRLRHEALVDRVDDLTRRLDRVELKLALYSLIGSATGALLGSAGSAAAKTLLGG